MPRDCGNFIVAVVAAAAVAVAVAVCSVSITIFHTPKKQPV
jgi:hypothetical protein